MSREDTRERTRGESDREGSSGRTSGRRRDRVSVSNRTSWTGLAKRAFNLSSRGGGPDAVGVATLGVAMLVGAFVAGLVPLVPLLWLVGLGAGAAVGGRFETGSVGAATAIGAVVGLVGGFAFASVPVLGLFLPVVTAAAGGVAGAVGYLAGLLSAQ